MAATRLSPPPPPPPSQPAHQHARLSGFEAAEERVEPSLSRASSALHLDALSTNDFELLHTLRLPGDDGVARTPLTMAAAEGRLFVGTSGGSIEMYNATTCEHLGTLVGHSRAVLSMALCRRSEDDTEQQLYLLTSSGTIAASDSRDGQLKIFTWQADGTVRAWNAQLQTSEHIVVGGDNCGDMLCVQGATNGTDMTCYMGSQSTSLQWLSLSAPNSIGVDWIDSANVLRRGDRANFRKTSYFFQSRQPADYLSQRERAIENDGSNSAAGPQMDAPRQLHVVPKTNILRSAHNGYVYCMILVEQLSPTLPKPASASHRLITGGGDGTIKCWSIRDNGSLEPQWTWAASDDAVLSLAHSDGMLYCGLQGGEIAIWDMEIQQCVRRLVEHTDDVVALLVDGQYVISGSTDGAVKLWRRDWNFACVRTLPDPADDSAGSPRTDNLSAHYEHCEAVLSMCTLGRRLFVAYASGVVKTRSLPELVAEDASDSPLPSDSASQADMLLFALRNFVRCRTISGSPRYSEECRAGARYIRSVLAQLGAQAQLVPGAEGRNPLVLGQFCATPSEQAPVHALFYGHYDVVLADKTEWDSPPFSCESRNEYIYGRGTSDNKGPILAAIFAVSRLLDTGRLKCNVSFLLEGEEESGSVGFQAAVGSLSDQLRGVNVVLLSNSSWLTREHPCLVYGQRGVTHAKITVEGARADHHSGVMGGLISEPLSDLVAVLSSLTDERRRILVPGFYDQVRPLDDAEQSMLDALVSDFNRSDGRCGDAREAAPALSVQEIKDLYLNVWRQPSLTVNRVETTGGTSNRTLIPRRASAFVSMRTVPDQGTAAVLAAFEAHLRDQFQRLTTTNRLEIDVTTKADWWLSDVQHPYYRICANAIRNVWGTSPLLIREGGSILPLHWLQKHFQCPIINIPLAQAGDGAHLANENIRLRNLLNGMDVFAEIISAIQNP
ncbi:hypothetical protein RI367_007399 [Sorochytrium milnesiophthora]